MKITLFVGTQRLKMNAIFIRVTRYSCRLKMSDAAKRRRNKEYTDFDECNDSHIKELAFPKRALRKLLRERGENICFFFKRVDAILK